MPVDDPLTGHTDPNAQCTCGWRRFRRELNTTSQAVSRWVNYAAETPEGYGSAPMGTFFGSGADGALWAEFDGTLEITRLTVTCENCSRVRSNKVLHQATVYGGYAEPPFYNVVVADYVSTGCISLEFRRAGLTPLPAALSKASAVPDPLPLGSPSGVSQENPPAGSLRANTLLRAAIPTAPEEGEYTVVLVNRCSKTEQVLGTVTLEVDVHVLSPFDADWNGVPDLWYRNNHVVQASSPQPQSGVHGIPFDKVDGVIEYDARFGTTPDAQGFTESDPATLGHYTTAPGGVVSVNTPGGATPSFWTASQALSATAGSIYSYARAKVLSAPAAAIGDGLEFFSIFDQAGSAVRYGSRTHITEAGVRRAALDNSLDIAFASGTDESPFDWKKVAVAAEVTTPRNLTWVNSEVSDDVAAAPLFTGSSTDVINAQFGDTAGNGITAYIQNYVVSAPGRFIRAHFVSYTAVTNPVLRLYVSSDLASGTDTLGRFLIRFGNLDPFNIPSSSVSQTFSFSARNTVFEIPIQLSGLTANQPFSFTVEREWDHPDDRTRSTLWLVQATVRSA